MTYLEELAQLLSNTLAAHCMVRTDGNKLIIAIPQSFEFDAAAQQLHSSYVNAIPHVRGIKTPVHFVVTNGEKQKNWAPFP